MSASGTAGFSSSESESSEAEDSADSADSESDKESKDASESSPLNPVHSSSSSSSSSSSFPCSPSCQIVSLSIPPLMSRYSLSISKNDTSSVSLCILRSTTLPRRLFTFATVPSNDPAQKKSPSVSKADITDSTGSLFMRILEIWSANLFISGFQTVTTPSLIPQSIVFGFVGSSHPEESSSSSWSSLCCNGCSLRISTCARVVEPVDTN
ncbi:hypothetical protein OGAPHI_003760 [Ogataea philodendri]|uniref:Uncharacterized protein n=1 Tax=Ogataea philodendri TaxID=1378263 RepID=A0A9P8P4B8_9ASCO|nr:uncharacterized protein OGAPHI_003760 [Ogataea philodendri]KAH3665573.1 hypothetical protein OGAPHI_003760 [Ogataea philodendri]